MSSRLFKRLGLEVCRHCQVYVVPGADHKCGSRATELAQLRLTEGASPDSFYLGSALSPTEPPLASELIANGERAPGPSDQEAELSFAQAYQGALRAGLDVAQKSYKHQPALEIDAQSEPESAFAEAQTNHSEGSVGSDPCNDASNSRTQQYHGPLAHSCYESSSAPVEDKPKNPSDQ